MFLSHLTSYACTLLDLHFNSSAALVSDLIIGISEDSSPKIHDLPNFNTQSSQLLQLASIHFNSGHFHRVPNILTHPSSDLELLLKCQSYFLIGQKSVCSTSVSLSSAESFATKSNPMIDSIWDSLSEFYSIPFTFSSSDLALLDNLPFFSIYFLSMCLIQFSKLELATVCLLKCLSKFPFFFEGWELLHNCLTRENFATHFSNFKNSFDESNIDCFMLMQCHFFSHSLISISRHDGIFEYLNIFSSYFPTSPITLELQARYHYVSRQFSKSRQLFEQLFDNFTHRYQGLEIYSNILYVSNDVSGLLSLSSRYSELDYHQYNWIFYIIKGNYLSLKEDHKSAVKMFLSAYQSNPTSSIPLILLGHELLELRNVEGALMVYQAASSKSPRDFRPLYSIAQLFEITGLHQFALQYYTNALEINPYDSRIYSALGLVFATIKDSSSAQKLFGKSLTLNPDDNVIKLHYASALVRCDDVSQAADFFWTCLKNDYNNELFDLIDDDIQGEILECAKEFKKSGKLVRAEFLANKLIDLGGIISQEALSFLSSFLSSMSTLSESPLNSFSPNPRPSPIANRKRLIRSPIQR
ncbi:hypothetical protein GEMRC1_011335 [Eukaryota sp. GEM-RC1]